MLHKISLGGQKKKSLEFLYPCIHFGAKVPVLQKQSKQQMTDLLDCFPSKEDAIFWNRQQ